MLAITKFRYIEFFSYRNSLITPPWEGGGGRGLFFSSPFEEEGLNRDGGLNIFQETTMVSFLHKELEYKVEKLKYRKF